MDDQPLNRADEQGIVLLTVLLFLSLLAWLAADMLVEAQLQLRMSGNLLVNSQQFQVAEAGLRLAQEQLANASMPLTQPIQRSQIYAQHALSYKIQRLAATVCVLPEHHLGHYYRLTATAQYQDNQATILEATDVQADGPACPPSMPTAYRGRSSWHPL